MNLLQDHELEYASLRCKGSEYVIKTFGDKTRKGVAYFFDYNTSQETKEHPNVYGYAMSNEEIEKKGIDMLCCQDYILNRKSSSNNEVRYEFADKA